MADLTNEEKNIALENIESEEQLIEYLKGRDENEKIDILKKVQYNIAISILRNRTIELDEKSREEVMDSLDESKIIETILDKNESIEFRLELVLSVKSEKQFELIKILQKDKDESLAQEEQKGKDEQEKDIALENIESEEQLIEYLKGRDENEKIDILKKVQYNIAISILQDRSIELDENARKNIIGNLDENQKIETALNEEANLYFRIELICSMEDTKKLEMLDKIEETQRPLSFAQKAQIISTMNNENKVKALKTHVFSPEVQIELFKGLSENNIIEIVNEMGNLNGGNHYINLEEYKKTYIDFFINNISDEGKLKIESKAIKDSLMISLSSLYDKEKIDFFNLDMESVEEELINIKNYLSDDTLKSIEVISSLSDKYDPLKIKYADILMDEIKNRKANNYKCDNSVYAATIELIENLTKDNKIEYVRKVNEILSKDEISHALFYLNNHSKIQKQTEKYIEIEYPDDFEEKKQLFSKINHSVFSVKSEINLGFLNDEYFNLFGDEKVDLITTSFSLQDKIVSLGGNEKNILSKLFPIVENNKEWNYYLNTMLDSLHNEHFSPLCSEILEYQEEFDCEKMLNIIINDSENLFEIQTIEDINNYEEIRKKICDKIINEDQDMPEQFKKMPSLDRKKFAYLERIYGHDIKVAQRIIEVYGEQVDEINNEELKNYVKSLKMILDEEDDKKIDQLCNVKGIDKELIDTLSVEKMLQEEYGKLFDKTLYRVQDSSEKYEGKEFGKNVSNIYDAGTDFRMVIHVVDVINDKDKKQNSRDNYYKYWNRDDFYKQMCCSYITKDQLTRARDGGITFGFVDMPKELVLMAPDDIRSDVANTMVISTRNKFVSPDELSNNTVKRDGCGWNELVYLPYESTVDNDGNVVKQKKQPDYLIAYKQDGQIVDNVNLILQVKKDFEEAGINLPIVVIDIDRCKEKPNEILEKKSEVTLDEFKENWEQCQQYVPERRMMLSKINNLSKEIEIAFGERGEN